LTNKANSRFKVDANCGCTLLQKTHDFSLDKVLDYLPVANRTQTLEQYQRKGIFIIRNPYSAIYSYRNFNFGGLKGTAAESAFKGPGKILIVFPFLIDGFKIND
jgi:hypothetical protein